MSSRKDQKTSQILTILYGTETGHAERIAQMMASEANAMGIDSAIKNMSDFEVSDFRSVQYLAVIVSTHGIGEPPISSERLFYNLDNGSVHILKHIRYSVLALGDKDYALFCQAGKDFDLLLQRHGAKKILSRVDCDVDYEDRALDWISDFLDACLID